MRAILTGVVATIEAIAVALSSLLIVALMAFLVWWIAFDLAAEPLSVFAGAGGVWLLAHFVPLSFELSAEVMQSLGFAPDALSFTLSLAPLGITAVTVGFALRAGWRFGTRGGSGGAGVLGGAVGFGAVAGVVQSIVPFATTGWLAAAAIAALVYGLSSGVGFVVRAAREGHDWWIALLSAIEAGLAKLNVPRPSVFPHRAGQTLRLAAMLLSGYVGLAALAFVLAVMTRFAPITAAAQTLQLDVWGAIVMFVLQLALLPVAVIWSGGWLSGAGFAVGAGSTASPFGQLLGPMPGVPLLAAIPEGWGSAAVLAPLLLVLVGVAIGVALGETARRETIARLLITVVCGAALAGLGVVLLSWAASGAIGPGRLAVAGPDIWITGALAAGELGVGCVLGAFAARADLGRRLVATPGDIAERLGLGASAEGAEKSREHAAASQAHPPLNGSGRDSTGGGSVHDHERDHDDEESPIRLAPVVALNAPGPGPGPGPGPEPDEQLTEPLDFEDEELRIPPPVVEAELFDQQDTTPSDARTATPETKQSGIELDPDALVEAYSWDSATPVEEERPKGWRWPGRKG